MIISVGLLHANISTLNIFPSAFWHILILMTLYLCLALYYSYKFTFIARCGRAGIIFGLTILPVQWSYVCIFSYYWVQRPKCLHRTHRCLFSFIRQMKGLVTSAFLSLLKEKWLYKQLCSSLLAKNNNTHGFFIHSAIPLPESFVTYRCLAMVSI